LVNIFSEFNNEKSILGNIEFKNNKKKMINEIDYIDVLVNALNKEADDLMNQIDNIEKFIDASKENLIKNNYNFN
jgi:predicted  nucleic acid-binding Zn-ribbon protein